MVPYVSLAERESGASLAKQSQTAHDRHVHAWASAATSSAVWAEARRRQKRRSNFSRVGASLSGSSASLLAIDAGRIAGVRRSNSAEWHVGHRAGKTC